VETAQSTDEVPTAKDFRVTANTIKWIVGCILGVGSLLFLYWAVTDKLDARWRLEQVQAAKDKEYAAELKRVDSEVKAARDKAELDTKALAAKAEQGRAWLQWSVVDTRADISTKLALLCRGLKLTQSECDRWADDARRTQDEAARKKTAAEESGKGK